MDKLSETREFFMVQTALVANAIGCLRDIKNECIVSALERFQKEDLETLQELLLLLHEKLDDEPGLPPF